MEYSIKSTAYEPEWGKLSLFEIYDKIQQLGFTTDKGTTHGYLETYEKLLTPFRDKECNLLEIGVDWGYSLYLWKLFMPKVHLFGIDLENRIRTPVDVRMGVGNANDVSVVRATIDNNRFDLIIDDASHEADHQLFRFELYWQYLNRGGVYIIEDVQNLDQDRQRFENMHPHIHIEDTRAKKNRYDDVMIWIQKPL